MEDRIAKGAIAQARARQNGAKIDPRSAPKRARIELKSSQHRAKVTFGRCRAILGDSGTSGDAPETPRDASGELPGRPGVSGNAPGTLPRHSRDAPRRSRDASGSVRRSFFATVACAPLLAPIFGRFLEISASHGGRPTCVSLAMAQSKRMSRLFRYESARAAETDEKRTEIERKWSENGGRTPPRASRAPTERPGERSFTQDARFFGRRSERRRGAAQKERFGGAVGAHDVRRPRRRV